jgi:hypothetical protein
MPADFLGLEKFSGTVQTRLVPGETGKPVYASYSLVCIRH